MKKMQFLLIAVLLASCTSSSEDDLVNVTGHIENNSEYRGGANPPQFLLDELAVYKPSSNQLFYVRDGQNYTPFSNTITVFQTNANGNFTLTLPAGNYAVISQDKFEIEQNPFIDSSCDYLLTPDFYLLVSTDGQSFDKQFTIKMHHCLPGLPN